MARGLTELGVVAEELENGLRVVGGPVHGGVVRTEQDHRIQMAFRVLSLGVQERVELDGFGCEEVSYPDFERDLGRIIQV
jgi:3-phosphoshikimate 1-carboxyvinyltransferase